MTLPLHPMTPIADLLALAALTPSAAARIIGVSRQAIAAAVKRGDAVTLATLAAWAEALGYRVEVRLAPPAPAVVAIPLGGPRPRRSGRR